MDRWWWLHGFGLGMVGRVRADHQGSRQREFFCRQSGPSGFWWVVLVFIKTFDGGSNLRSHRSAYKDTCSLKLMCMCKYMLTRCLASSLQPIEYPDVIESLRLATWLGPDGPDGPNLP